MRILRMARNKKKHDLQNELRTKTTNNLNLGHVEEVQSMNSERRKRPFDSMMVMKENKYLPIITFLQNF